MKSQGRRPGRLFRLLALILPPVATLALTILLFLAAHRREEEDGRAAFQDRAQALAASFQSSCKDHLEALHSLSSALSILPAFGPSEFRRIALGELARRPAVQALSWNPVVHDTQVAGLSITERDSRGRLVQAARRDEYVPVLYIEPLEGNQKALGFDVSSEPIRREALERARETGDVAATGPIRLVVQEGTESSAVLLFSPVYRADGKVLRGYAVAALRIGTLVDTAGVSLHPKGITFALYDMQDEAAPELLYAGDGWQERPAGAAGEEWQESFRFGGRAWEIRVAALPSARPVQRRAWLILAAGLLFTGLLGAFLFVLDSRTTKVEELVVYRTVELQRELQERQRTEEVLRASEARYRAIFGHMIGGMLTFDGLGRIESVNPAAERMTGYREDELIGQSLVLLLADVPESDSDGFLRQAHRSSIGKVTEWRGRRKDGEIFPFEGALFRFETPEGGRFGANFQDISERREVDRLKAEFVATVSHELRTPLTSIRGSLGLLAAGVLGELTPQVRDLVSLAERNAVRLAALVNDILDFERLEGGQIQMRLADVDLQPLLDQSLESMRLMAAEQRIVLLGTSTAARVRADADRIVQVLMNLLSNAIKFSPADCEVQIWAEEREGGRVRVFVRDQGPGISDGQRQRIFDRFVQVEVTDKREPGGTGLGLAICKAIVEHHGGRIGVDSEPRVGSTFWFELPGVVSEVASPV